MYYANQDIKDLCRIFDQNERKEYLRLDLNENPGGLPREFVAKVLEGTTPEFVAQYPETRHFTEVLAGWLGTSADHICLVNGSAEGIRYIIQAFTSPGGQIVGVTPSYFMFQVYAEMYGREFVTIPYEDDLSMDVERIIGALSNDVQLLVLLNPNNPMGNVYSDDEFDRVMAAAREHNATVLVDEAYYLFHPKSFIRYALEGEHVFVTRTFSKLFSMAGCRLGYVVGWPEGIELVQKLCTPHNTNAFALRFAEEAIQSPELIESLVDAFNEGREYLISALDEHEYPHKGEAGNFIFIRPKTDAKELVNRMKVERSILIKSYEGVGELGTCLRVTIGEKKFMERFIDALFKLDSPSWSHVS